MEEMVDSGVSEAPASHRHPGSTPGGSTIFKGMWQIGYALRCLRRRNGINTRHPRHFRRRARVVECPTSQAGDNRIDTGRRHHICRRARTAECLVFHTSDSGFNSRLRHQVFALQAHRDELPALNRKAVGSNPTQRTRLFRGCRGGVLHLSVKQAAQARCTFESCPRSQIPPSGGRCLKPSYKRSRQISAWIVDRHHGRGPSYGKNIW